SSTVCRASAGVCDPAESCTGSSAACPADALASSSTVCRASAGVCDPAESCTGSSAACPADALAPSSTVCRAAAGGCDAVAGQTCPSDAKKTSGTVCTDDGNLCTTDTCDGSSNLCQHAPGNPLGTCLTQTKSAAGTCVNATGIGTLAWSNASRAQTSDNNY